MSKLPKRLLIAVVTFAIGISAVIGGYYYRESQRVKLELPNHRWEPLFFKEIDKTTELGGLEQLRTLHPRNDDLEVRIWRGFGLGSLEGVILRRTNDQWNAFHVKADHYAEPKEAVVDELKPPKSGWDPFWKNITDRGLLTLRDPSEKNCEDDGLDGTGYVVEINANSVYRTYQMREGGKCDGVRQMEEIDDVVGEEFDSGQEQCKTTEWFACAKLRKSYRERRREKRPRLF